MRKTILTILAAALLAASTVQIAAAAERHKVHKVYRAPAPVTDQYRNADAYYVEPAPVPPDWSRYDEWSRYQNGALSAPAGR